MTEQTDLFALARERADVGIQRAADATEAREPGWTELATEALRSFVKSDDKPHTMEMIRAGIEKGLPPCHDLRTWGAVTRMAKNRGYIEAIPGQFFAAASSNGSGKPVYRAGPNA